MPLATSFRVFVCGMKAPKLEGLAQWAPRLLVSYETRFWSIHSPSILVSLFAHDISTRVNIYSEECIRRFLSTPDIHLFASTSIMRGKVNTRLVMYQYLNNISICPISPIFSQPPPSPLQKYVSSTSGEGGKSISATITSLIGPRLHHHRLQIQTARFQKIWISKILNVDF